MGINQPDFTPQKKNKVSPLILMGGFAVVLGLIAAIGIGQYLTSQQQKVQELTVMKKVIVASHDIPAGAKLIEADVVVKEYPAQQVPADYPSSFNLLKNREVKAPILKDDFVTEAKLVPIVVASGLTAIIPPGMRAITIMITDVSGVSGFIKAGDYIDVLSLYKTKEDFVSKSIFEHVLVLAVGTSLPDPKAPPSNASNVVNQLTLAVTPEDAEKIFLATNTGQIQLTLRPFGDKNIVASAGIFPEDVYGYSDGDGSSRRNRLGGATPSLMAPKKNIEVILGGSRSYKVF